MIGVTDAETEGQWIDFNGDSLNYTNWKSGEPNNSNNEDYACFALGAQNGVWNDLPMEFTDHILCEKSSQASSQACPAGWDMHTIENKNKCFKNLGISNAKEALTLCQDLNAVLPVVQTKGCF